jgi:hypothetical protein
MIKLGYAIVDMKNNKLGKTGGTWTGKSAKIYDTEGRANAALKTSGLDPNTHLVFPAFAMEIDVMPRSKR